MNRLIHWVRYPVLFREPYPGGWFSVWLHWHLGSPRICKHHVHGTHIGITLVFCTLFFSNNEA
jgi:hypothetical protein